MLKNKLWTVLQDISAKYGALSEEDGVAFRATYIINPEGVLEHISINNMGIGRNIDETKRVLQAVQFVAEHGEVCPDSLNAPPHRGNVSPVDSHGVACVQSRQHCCIPAPSPSVLNAHLLPSFTMVCLTSPFRLVRGSFTRARTSIAMHEAGSTRTCRPL